MGCLTGLLTWRALRVRQRHLHRIATRPSRGQRTAAAAPSCYASCRRGAEKVAVRRAVAAHTDAVATERFNAPALEARGIDQAIAVLSIATEGSTDGGAAAPAAAGGAGAASAASADEHAADLARLAAAVPEAPGLRPDDRHPEKRMKAAYAKFVDDNLPVLKAEFPTLRRSQLNEILFRKWQKHPDNPINRAKAAATAAANAATNE